jgi:anti-sigma B factor antagonist
VTSSGADERALGLAASAAQGEPAAAPNRLCIDGEMTLPRALALRDLLLEALEKSISQLDVDLSGVRELDTAGVQVLLLAKRTALGCGKELRLAGQNDAVMDVLELLHLDSYFGEPEFVLFDSEDAQ